MSITEILNEIHNNNAELEVYNALHDWLLNDRDMWEEKAMKNRAILNAVNKIATKNKSPKNALEGIINLCSED